MNQQEFVGINKIQQLKEILAGFTPGKLLLFAGKNSYVSSGAAERIEPLLKAVEVIKYSDFSLNPNMADVDRVYAKLKKEKFDLVMAVGGGSVIDFAKIINAAIAQSEGEPRDYIIGKKALRQKGKPLIAIPTTSGSGSEATSFAVVYVDKIKYSLDHPYILPDIAIVDSNLTMTMPKEVAASSGMDALSQAIESYWSIRANDESKNYAKEAIPLIINNMVEAVSCPNLENRSAMALGAHLAGKAINISRTTAPHAVSYPLTINYGISHGQSVSFMLTEFFSYNYDVNEHDVVDARGWEYVKSTIEELSREIGCNDVPSAINKIRGLQQRIGLLTRLSQVCISDKDIPVIIEGVDLNRLSNNPRKVTMEALKKILFKII